MSAPNRRPRKKPTRAETSVPIQLYRNPAQGPKATTAAAISTNCGAPRKASTEKLITATGRAAGPCRPRLSHFCTLSGPFRPSSEAPNTNTSPTPPNSTKLTATDRQAAASMLVIRFRNLRIACAYRGPDGGRKPAGAGRVAEVLGAEASGAEALQVRHPGLAPSPRPRARAICRAAALWPSRIGPWAGHTIRMLR